MSATPLYIVEHARFSSGDVSGSLMTDEGVTLYSHMSSSRGWLEADLTKNFGRAEELAERFGQFVVEYVSGDDPLPDCLVPYFESGAS